ncbi:MAG: extracellular solute-binding protein, partial [Candidatus Dormibacteria bacterium]
MNRWLRQGRGPGVSTALGVATMLAMTGCGQAAGGGSVGASAKQTITFAESGLGSEGAQTQKAINGFERANPNIKVNILVLSPNSTTYLQQLEQRFIAGSSTPDVLESDVTYPAKFAQAG